MIEYYVGIGSHTDRFTAAVSSRERGRDILNRVGRRFDLTISRESP